MLHNDLSNQVSYTIAFRCEDSLFKHRKSKVFDVVSRIAPKLRSYYLVGKLNEDYVRAMEYIYRNTEYTVDVVIEEANYTPYVKKVLEDLPFNRVIKIRNESAITTRLTVGDISIYVDEDTERLSLVNREYAMPISKLSEIMKRRY